MRRTILPVILSCLLALVAAAAAATAASAAVTLGARGFSVSESKRYAVVTIVRDHTRGGGQIRYGTWPGTARRGLDYRTVKARIDFEPGQSQLRFRVPIVDDDRVERRETIRIAIFGGYPERAGKPRKAMLTIVDDDDVSARRNERNPLALTPRPPRDNPLQGARFYQNRRGNLAARVIREIRRRRPRAAKLLRVIANQPEAKRFGSFNHRPAMAVGRYLERAHAREPGSVALLSTYRLRHVRCGNVSDSRKQARRYKKWYRKFAQGVGNHRAIVFFEIDALITTKCLSRHGLRVRIGELRSAIRSLARLPHAVVYIDAGSALAHSPGYIARLLRQVGVQRIQGFFTNATHQSWTRTEIRYGRKLIRLLGGRPHQVINTATNGQGPLVPADRARYGNSFRCNAPGRGLGPRPTARIPRRYRHLDGFFWIGNPGRSAGDCSKTPGAPPAGAFWVDYAISLIRHADYRIR